MSINDIGISVMVKGEQSYYKDWLKWHRKRGFGPIEVFLDNPEETGQYEADLETIVTREGPSRQYQTLNDYFFTKTEEDGWRLIIDIDEYADFTADELRELIADNPDEYAFRFPQVIYIAENAAYRYKTSTKPVVERFPKVSIGGSLQRGKPLIKLGMGIGLRSVHDPAYMSKQGKNLVPVSSVGDEPYMAFRIRHFITKSEEEWMKTRIGRECISGKKYSASAFALYNELKGSESRESIRRMKAAGLEDHYKGGNGTCPLPF